MKNKKLHLLKGDILIIVMIIVLAIVIFVGMLPKTYSENTLEVYLDGELIHEIELSEEQTMTIDIDSVVHNTIEINGIHVRIIDSTCYDHVCENTGYISKAGEVIVCMPNKLMLKIVGIENDDAFDAVVG
ncbi:MAG: NusG domain II-containing protein [Eubacteriales bacterium]